MHFAAILAVAAVSVFAVPLTDTEVVAPVKGVVSAVADVFADIDAAVGNVAVKGSDVADNIDNNNDVSVLPRDLVTVGALIEALANALAKADVSLKAVLANVDVQDSSILTDILNDNKITVLRRRDVVLPANIDAIVLAFIDALVAAGVNVQAAVANIGIDYSTLLSNIGNNNVIFVRSLPETVDIVALVNALAKAAAAVGVNVDAVIANIKIDNSNILTNILDGNSITVLRRNGVTLPDNIDAIVLAFINAAVAAGADVQAAVANIGIDYSTLLSNIGNNNVIFVRSLPETVDILALVKAVADALAAVGVDAKAVIANIDIQNSSILDDILNGNSITVLRRGSVILPANIDAIVEALINALVSAGVNVQAALANIGIDQSTLLSNIGDNNVIFVRSLPETVDIAALVKALADAAAAVGVDINAVIANIDIQNSSILTDILNGNSITVLRRNNVILPANIDAIVLALINAAVAAGVNVQAAVANIGINYSTLLSNIGNNNVVFVRSLPETVDIVALVNAIAKAAAAVGVDINALIGNINIENSSILTNILNGNTVVLGRRDLLFPLITADILAVLKAIVEAALDANIDVFATALNAGLDSATILSNILNNNSITVLPIFARDASALDVYSTVLALVQALIAIGVPVDIFALNAFIQNSNIGTNILNNNIISILGI
ncbi:hypothetical protein M422DRAFT_254108 [Sphaerobolus stellatus SS14]|uniref:Uncharacterized protein n=1 Tax=Sphaerobolus stellatus (strain SS14) TaxID=990650 RepID=A0A0C9VLM6_SPHS4|nr:hypothetical protein M422DRAFT_254108 [Sphaerobolus stellatus SS14]